MSQASDRYYQINTELRNMLVGGNGSPAALGELDGLWLQMTDEERDAVQAPHKRDLPRHYPKAEPVAEVHVAAPARVFVAPDAPPLPGLEMPATERAVVAAVERAIMRGDGDAPEPVAKTDEAKAEAPTWPPPAPPAPEFVKKGKKR